MPWLLAGCPQLRDATHSIFALLRSHLFPERFEYAGVAADPVSQTSYNSYSLVWYTRLDFYRALDFSLHPFACRFSWISAVIHLSMVLSARRVGRKTYDTHDEIRTNDLQPSYASIVGFEATGVINDSNHGISRTLLW